MRELSFSQLWPKLAKPRCTTFRFTRKDKDWYVGETVKVLFKARSPKDRSVLGIAVIVDKVPRYVCWLSSLAWLRIPIKSDAPWVTDHEAKLDGFSDMGAMIDFMANGNRQRYLHEPMNKLTLAWTQYWPYVPEQKLHVAKEWAKLLGKENMIQRPRYWKPQYTKE